MWTIIYNILHYNIETNRHLIIVIHTQGVLNVAFKPNLAYIGTRAKVHMIDSPENVFLGN